ncbi:MAG: hypothetical protein ABIA75_09320 [Candidatus Neomarinimicrobiota bacterium]
MNIERFRQLIPLWLPGLITLVMAQSADPADPYYGLKTRKILVFSYVDKSADVQQELDHIIRIDYNRTGLTTDSTLLDSAGMMLATTAYLFDRKGFLFEVKQLDSANSVQWRQTFSYDNQGRCINKTWIDTANNIFRTVDYRLAASGQPVSITTFTAADSATERLVNRFNDNGRLLEKRWYDSESRLVRKSEFNTSGNLTGTLRYFTDGSLQWKYVYSSSTKNGLVETQTCRSQDVETRTEYNHNQVEKFTELKHFDGQGRLLYRITFNYNDRGDLTAVTEYTDKGRLSTRSTYEYDENHRLLAEQHFAGSYSGDVLTERPLQLILYEYIDYY